jgi:hypothetical protein
MDDLVMFTEKLFELLELTPISWTPR